jgi:hypothetical protein
LLSAVCCLLQSWSYLSRGVEELLDPVDFRQDALHDVGGVVDFARQLVAPHDRRH